MKLDAYLHVLMTGSCNSIIQAQSSYLFCMKLSYTFETWEIKGNRKAFSKLVKKLCPFHTIFLRTFQLFLEASMRKTWTIA